MWAHLIIVLSPAFDQHLGFSECIENFPIQEFISQFAIETLIVAILPRAVRFDKQGAHTSGGGRSVREALFHLTELEGGKLKGEIDLGEAFFEGKRKGKRERAAAGKSVVFGLLERENRVYTKVVESVSADELMRHSSQDAEGFGLLHRRLSRLSVLETVRETLYDQSLQDVRQSPRRVKNHINGIEGFWSYAKHILYHYRGVSKYQFPMYLKEIEYRFIIERRICSNDS
jgi:transposase